MQTIQQIIDNPEVHLNIETLVSLAKRVQDLESGNPGYSYIPLREGVAYSVSHDKGESLFRPDDGCIHISVSGPRQSGKTLLLRLLAHALEPMGHIFTVDNAFHEDKDRPIPHPSEFEAIRALADKKIILTEHYDDKWPPFKLDPGHDDFGPYSGLLDKLKEAWKSRAGEIPQVPQEVLDWAMPVYIGSSPLMPNIPLREHAFHESLAEEAMKPGSETASWYHSDDNWYCENGTLRFGKKVVVKLDPTNPESVEELKERDSVLSTLCYMLNMSKMQAGIINYFKEVKWTEEGPILHGTPISFGRPPALNSFWKHKDGVITCFPHMLVTWKMEANVSHDIRDAALDWVVGFLNACTPDAEDEVVKERPGPVTDLGELDPGKVAGIRMHGLPRALTEEEKVQGTRNEAVHAAIVKDILNPAKVERVPPVRAYGESTQDSGPPTGGLVSKLVDDLMDKDYLYIDPEKQWFDINGSLCFGTPKDHATVVTLATGVDGLKHRDRILASLCSMLNLSGLTCEYVNRQGISYISLKSGSGYLPMPEAPPVASNDWRHKDGVLMCGTLMVASWNMDTGPSEAVRDNILDWMCYTLNTSVPGRKRIVGIRNNGIAIDGKLAD